MSIYQDTFIFWYCCILAAIIGAVLGSFLNCTAYRLARGQAFARGKSRCPSCGHDLGVSDLVPVLSWLGLRGRCRYCKSRIPARYPLTELFMAAMAVLCLLQFDLTVEALRNFVFGCCLFCLALVDLEAMLIPDGCLLAALLAWAAALPFLGVTFGWIGLRLLAAVLYGGGLLLISIAMDHFLGKESMGGGDIKLFALVGLYLGLAGTLFTVLLACILGLLLAAFLRKKGQAFPFGPAIAAAAWVMLLYGEGFVNWYLGLVGIG